MVHIFSPFGSYLLYLLLTLQVQRFNDTIVSENNTETDTLSHLIGCLMKWNLLFFNFIFEDVGYREAERKITFTSIKKVKSSGGILNSASLIKICYFHGTHQDTYEDHSVPAKALLYLFIFQFRAPFSRWNFTCHRNATLFHVKFILKWFAIPNKSQQRAKHCYKCLILSPAQWKVAVSRFLCLLCNQLLDG